MTQHTSGPWRVTQGDTPRQKFLIRGSNNAMLAMSYWDDLLMESIDEPEANARLIAAAPELLETLKKLTQILAEQGDELAEAAIAYLPEWNEAVEAIAKAEGKA